MTRSLVLACLLLLAVTTAGAPAATAPGRVAFSITGQVPQFGDTSGASASAGAALPGGSVLTFAYDNPTGTPVALKLQRNGALDPAFGTNGMVRLTAPGPGFRVFQSQHLEGGKLLIAGAQHHPVTPYPGRLVLLRLLPDGALDPSFGAGGILPTSILSPAGAPMAVAPDGSIVVTGTLQSPTETNPLNPSTSDWVVAKLTPDGAADAGFGIVRITFGGARKLGGSRVVVTPTGSIVVLGHATSPAFREDVLLAGLTALGLPDPAFNGGAPTLVPLDVFDAARSLHRRASGAVDVSTPRGIVRFGAGGALDPSFAAGGRLAFPPSESITSVVDTPDGGALIVGLPTPGPFDRDRSITVTRLTSNGALADATVLYTPFGGGFAAPGKRAEVSVEQNSFGGKLLRRDDGSYLVLGGLTVSTPNGKMDAAFAPFVAAQAFTAALAPDPTFGGPQQPASVQVRIGRQRAVTAGARRYIKLKVTAAQAGLIRLRVRDRRNRIIASGTHAVYSHGTGIVRVLLTTPGRRILERASKDLRITVRHDYRDILTARATGVTKGRLLR